MSLFQLTPDIEHKILSFIRGGGFPEVASEAAGIPHEVFNRWRRRGERRGAEPRFRAFALAVRQAIAQARLRAEVEVYKDRPLDWLRSGPGREMGDRPGWTGNARARTGKTGAEVDVLAMPELRELILRFLEAVEPHPEAHAALAEVAGKVMGEK